MKATFLDLLILVPASAAAAAAPPRFSDFASGGIYEGPSARPILIDPATREFRTRILEGSRGAPNFAGHYHMIEWGCGTSCSQGAIVDAQTGHVTMLPFSICCYAGPTTGDFDVIEFKLSSNLVVFHGERNNEGTNGDHYYLFDGRSLNLLQSKQITGSDQPAPLTGDRMGGASAAELAACANIVSPRERLMCFDVLSGHSE